VPATLTLLGSRRALPPPKGPGTDVEVALPSHLGTVVLNRVSSVGRNTSPSCLGLDQDSALEASGGIVPSHPCLAHLDRQPGLHHLGPFWSEVTSRRACDALPSR